MGVVVVVVDCGGCGLGRHLPLVIHIVIISTIHILGGRLALLCIAIDIV